MKNFIKSIFIAFSILLSFSCANLSNSTTLSITIPNLNRGLVDEKIESGTAVILLTNLDGTAQTPLIRESIKEGNTTCSVEIEAGKWKVEAVLRTKIAATGEPGNLYYGSAEVEVIENVENTVDVIAKKVNLPDDPIVDPDKPDNPEITEYDVEICGQSDLQLVEIPENEEEAVFSVNCKAHSKNNGKLLFYWVEGSSNDEEESEGSIGEGLIEEFIKNPDKYAGEKDNDGCYNSVYTGTLKRGEVKAVICFVFNYSALGAEQLKDSAFAMSKPITVANKEILEEIVISRNPESTSILCEKDENTNFAIRCDAKSTFNKDLLFYWKELETTEDLEEDYLENMWSETLSEVQQEPEIYLGFENDFGFFESVFESEIAADQTKNYVCFIYSFSDGKINEKVKGISNLVSVRGLNETNLKFSEIEASYKYLFIYANSPKITLNQFKDDLTVEKVYLIPGKNETVRIAAEYELDASALFDENGIMLDYVAGYVPVKVKVIDEQLSAAGVETEKVIPVTLVITDDSYGSINYLIKDKNDTSSSISKATYGTKLVKGGEYTATLCFENGTIFEPKEWKIYNDENNPDSYVKVEDTCEIKWNMGALHDEIVDDNKITADVPDEIDYLTATITVQCAKECWDFIYSEDKFLKVDVTNNLFEWCSWECFIRKVNESVPMDTDYINIEGDYIISLSNDGFGSLKEIEWNLEFEEGSPENARNYVVIRKSDNSVNEAFLHLVHNEEELGISGSLTATANGKELTVIRFYLAEQEPASGNGVEIILPEFVEGDFGFEVENTNTQSILKVNTDQEIKSISWYINDKSLDNLSSEQIIGIYAEYKTLVFELKEGVIQDLPEGLSSVMAVIEFADGSIGIGTVTINSGK